MSQNLSMLDKSSWLYAQGGTGKQRRGKKNADSGYGAVYIDVDKSSGSSRQIEGLYGVLKDPISIAMEATWTTMDTINVPFVKQLVGSVGKIMEGLGEAVGGGEIGATWKSKQVWQRSGYLTISLTFIVVDWEGDGAPLTAARNAYLYVTPGAATEWVTAASGLTQGAMKGAGAVASVMRAAGANGAADMANQGAYNLLKDSEDWFLLRASPPPVRLRVGQYFDRNDLIVKSVEPKFSKEVTEMGPMSVEITMTLSSRSIIDGGESSDLGFVDSTERSQVTIGSV